MAPIEIKCGQCGKTTIVKPEFAGKKGKCPVCGKVINIPDPSKTLDTLLDVNEDLSDDERKKVAMTVASVPSTYRKRKRGFFAWLFGRKKR